jgi:DNA-binding response OmpR family regulator
VLIVEDDWFVAQVLAQELEDIGAEILGPVPSVADALRLLDEQGRPDVAVLDVELKDGLSSPVADALRAQKVPTVVATGRSCTEVEALYPDLPCVAKPLAPSKVLELLGRV